MSKEECRRFEKKLAFHTAPSLLGIKCASLFTLSRSEFGKLIPKENANEYYGFFDIFGKFIVCCNENSGTAVSLPVDGAFIGSSVSSLDIPGALCCVENKYFKS